MMRNTYQTPEIEIIYVSEDIITTSGSEPQGIINGGGDVDFPMIDW